VKGLWGDTVASVRETNVTGKASHRGHRGGIGVGGERFLGDTVASVRERTLREKHRTEVTEATEEGLGWGERSLVDTVASVLEREQRTEATEEDLGLRDESFLNLSVCVDFPALRRFRTEARAFR
jgi:hypothetical protein